MSANVNTTNASINPYTSELETTALEVKFDEQSKRFLNYLSQGKIDTEQFTFQTFPERAGATGAPVHWTATLDDSKEKITQKVNQGHAVCVMINKGDGQGRTASNVLEVRAGFVDDDGHSDGRIETSDIPFQCIVRSSNEGRHAYILVKNCPMAKFTHLQISFAVKHCGDPAVSDLPRVMRLPGTYNQKAEPFLVTIERLDENPEPIEYTEIRCEAEQELATKTQVRQRSLELLDISQQHDILEGRRNVTLFKHALQQFQYGQLEESVNKLIMDANERLCKPPLSDKEVNQIVHSAGKFAAGNPSEHYSRHITFAKENFHDIRRHLLDDELYVQIVPKGEWFLVRDALSYLCGLARCKGLFTKEQGLSRSGFLDCLEVYKYFELVPELLIGTAEWDGVQRIRAITDHIVATHLSSDEVFEVILQWLGNLVQKMYDSSINQTFLVLASSKQGLGKDGIIEALCGGLGRYFQPLTLGKDENQNNRAIAQIIVGNIAELDKIDFLHAAELKDLITKPDLFINQKFKVTYQRCPHRASFIGTSNEVSRVLRDHSGNRRYEIIEIEDIKLDRDARGIPVAKNHYYGDRFDPIKRQNRLQILAEARYHAEHDSHRASAQTLRHMKEIIDSLTPLSFDQEIAELWDAMFVEKFRSHVYENLITPECQWVIENQWLSYQKALPVIEYVARLVRKSVRVICTAMKTQGLAVNEQYFDGKKTRGYRFNASRLEPTLVKMIMAQNGISGLTK